MKYLRIPIRGTCYSDINLVEHYRQSRAAWHMIEVGDNRVSPSEGELAAIDDIGIFNLENALETECCVNKCVFENSISGFSHYLCMGKTV